ncbi:MAG: hypothetical protein Q4A58_06375 [Fusobacterium sp.]|uniref:hypothetical protein n=1 Tax=Fusobacterium sp. TaxID=68766 RepID=UPI0026DB239C|nr:hypothetical protein [Fusobacterium sp.]MDO4690901.1 hypothetical protein [Fusobacterium sp.]
MSTDINTKSDFNIKLYYEFGGSIEWLREEIIKKRYDSFRYLLPIKSKSNANIIFEISSSADSEEKYITITSLLKFANIINLPKIICKNLKLNSEECAFMYSYLKETYFEK